MAEFLPQFRGGLKRFRELASPCFHCPRGTGAVTIMIDDCVAQYPIEPGDRFFAVNGRIAFQSTNEGSLKDIFRDGFGLDAPLQKFEELTVPFHQPRNRFRR